MIFRQEEITLGHERIVRVSPTTVTPSRFGSVRKGLRFVATALASRLRGRTVVRIKAAGWRNRGTSSTGTNRAEFRSLVRSEPFRLITSRGSGDPSGGG